MIFLTPLGDRFRVMLDIVSVRHLLIPFGMSFGYQPFREHGRASWFTYREVFIFGFRVARWVVELGPPTFREEDYTADPGAD